MQVVTFTINTFAIFFLLFRHFISFYVNDFRTLGSRIGTVLSLYRRNEKVRAAVAPRGFIITDHCNRLRCPLSFHGITKRNNPSLE